VSDGPGGPRDRCAPATGGPATGRPTPVDGVITTLLAETVAEHLAVRPGELSPELHLADDLGVDSLAVLDLGMRLEDVFDVWLTDEQLGSLVTFADLDEAVREAVDRRTSNGT